MALGSPSIPIFQAALASHGLIGSNTIQLATGCANGLQLYMSGIGCTTISIDVGTLGAGTGIGFGIILAQPLLSVNMVSTFLGFLLGGPFSPITADAISLGICSSLAIASISTFNAGVGVGAGVVKCIPQGVGGTVFTSAFLASGMSGSMVPSLGQAVGGALDASIASALGAVVIVGPPSILPGGGIGIGQVF
jgi:hypothetical protein